MQLTEEIYIVGFDDAQKLIAQNGTLNRIPGDIICGVVGYHFEEDEEKADAFPDSQGNYGAQPRILSPGEYGYFQVDSAGKIIVPKNSEFNFTKSYVYDLSGVLCATPRSYAAATFYMIRHALMSLSAFSLLPMLSCHGIDTDAIDDLKGLNSRNPWLALMMLLIMFSMAGIPPLLRFFTKVMVLEALIHIHLIWVAGIVLILAAIGAYYYIRAVKVMLEKNLKKIMI